MSYTEQFTETHDVLATIPPLAVNQAVGFYATAWFSMADYHRGFVFMIMGEAMQGATIDVAMQQARDATGLGIKALTTVAYAAVPAAAKSPVQIVAANQGNYIGIEFRSEEFDVDNGFVFGRVTVTVAVDAYEYAVVVFGQPARYEPVGITDFQEVVV